MTYEIIEEGNHFATVEAPSAGAAIDKALADYLASRDVDGIRSDYNADRGQAVSAHWYARNEADPEDCDDCEVELCAGDEPEED